MFDRDIKTIGKHINNVLKEELIHEPSTIAKFAIVQKEADRHTGKLREVVRNIEHYNLDVIISVWMKKVMSEKPTLQILTNQSRHII